MSIVLLDTNIVSFVLKGDTRAAAYAPHLTAQTLALSFMTVAELHQWAAVRRWGEQRVQELDAQLTRYLVIPFDIAVCRLWGQVRATCQVAGRPISVADAWVAATAVQHRLPLVTHNRADFQAVQGLTIITTIT